MATVSVTTYVTYTDASGDTHTLGSLTSANTVTTGGQVLDKQFTLATATTVDIWSSADVALTNFDFLYIESDYPLFLEITVDRGADVGKEEIAIKVCANDVPFMLDNDDGKANYTADFAAGSDDVIDQLRIRNESGSTANVRFLLAT